MKRQQILDVWKREVHIVEYLKSNFLDVSLEYVNKCPLSFIEKADLFRSSIMGRRLDIFESLIERKVKIPKGICFYFELVANPQWHVSFLKHMIALNIKPQNDLKDYDILINASRHSSGLEKLALLVDNNIVSIRAKNYYGRTFLHLMIMRASETLSQHERDMIQFAVSRGADIHCKDGYGYGDSCLELAQARLESIIPQEDILPLLLLEQK